MIDQQYKTRQMMTEALATQFFGAYVGTEKWSDRSEAIMNKDQNTWNDYIMILLIFKNIKTCLCWPIIYIYPLI